MKRYLILAIALLLAVGAGIAVADADGDGTVINACAKSNNDQAYSGPRWGPLALRAGGTPAYVDGRPKGAIGGDHEQR